MEKRFYDFLGNELFDGDEVITIKKNGRAVGGDLVKVKIKIEDGKLEFNKDLLPSYIGCNLYKNNIGDVCYKVVL